MGGPGVRPRAAAGRPGTTTPGAPPPPLRRDALAACVVLLGATVLLAVLAGRRAVGFAVVAVLCVLPHLGGTVPLVAGDLGLDALAAGCVLLGGRRGLAERAGGLVEIRVLGPLRVVLADGTPVEPSAWRGAKNAELLRLLAVSGEPVPVDVLCRVLWPAADRRRALASLRQACLELRRVLGPRHLVRSGDRLGLDGVWVDAGAFRSLAAAGRSAHARGAHGDCVRAALDAEALHVEPFEPGLLAHEAVEALAEDLRDTRRRLLLDAADSALAGGDLRLAAGLARGHLAQDRLSERAYRCLMTALAARGETARALAVYTQCRRELAEELGADPSPATRELYAALLAGGPLPTAGTPGDPLPTAPTLSSLDALRRVEAGLDPAARLVLQAMCVLPGPVTEARLAGLLRRLDGPGASGDADVSGLRDALHRLQGLAVVVLTGDVVTLQDGGLAAAVRAALRPAVREVLLRAATPDATTPDGPAQEGPVPAPAPATEGALALRQARDALARRRIALSVDLAVQAAGAAGAADPASAEVRGEAHLLRLLPAVLLGGRPDLPAALARARAEAAASGAARAAARLDLLATLVDGPDGFAGVPGARHPVPVVPAVRAVRHDAWVPVRAAADAGRGHEALALAATVDRAGLDDLARQLLDLAVAAAHEAAGDLDRARRAYEALLHDRRRTRFVLAEAAARLAGLRADDDPQAALDLLDLLEGWLDTDGERPRERFWRLLARARVRAALGRPHEGARAAATATGLAGACGSRALAAHAEGLRAALEGRARPALAG